MPLFQRIAKLRLGRDGLLLSVILIAGFCVRLYGINFALPQWDEYGTFDETFYALNNHLSALAFEHGSLLSYLVLLIWYPVGIYLQRSLPNTYTLLVMYYQNPIAFAVLARLLSVVASTATIGAIYLCGARLYNRIVGLLAAFFLAFTFLHVTESHYIRSYALVTFFATLTLFFCVRLLDDDRLRNYFLAGAFIGLAAAAQYSGVLLVSTLLAAHVLSTRRSLQTSAWVKGAIFSKRLVIALDSAGLAFFLVTPYALLDFPRFAASIKAFVLHGQSIMPQVSSEGQPIWLFYLTEHLTGGMGLVLEIVALAGLVYLLYRHRSQDVVLLVFPMLYLITLNDSVNFARYAVPLLPFLAMSAATLLHEITIGLVPRLHVRWRHYLLVGLAIILAIPSGLNIARFDFWITQNDTRLVAAQWINSHISSGATIVVEGAGVLGPPIPANRQVLDERIADGPPDGLEVLIAKALKTTLRAGPTYHVTIVSRLDQRHQGGALVGFIPNVQGYADDGIDYLITVSWMVRTGQDHYSAIFQNSLDTLYKRVAEFQPTVVFRWDPYAWRVDYEALSQISPGRPTVGGPVITIYRRIGSNDQTLSTTR